MNKTNFFAKRTVPCFALILLFVTACSSNGKVKIGFLLPNMVDERSIKERAYFIAKVNELGGEALVADAKFNDQLQISQAKDLISQGARVLVVMAVNKNTAAAIVRVAHDRGVKVIAYERIISNCDLDYYISFDNVKVGELMAAFALKAKPEGNYILLCGDKGDQNAIWVRQGQEKLLQSAIKAGNIKIVYDSYIEDWSGDNAYFETKRYLNLTSKVPDVILSAYDGMSTGAIKALEENNVRNLPLITGQNAELQACRNIMNGKQNMTVYKSLKTEASQAAELAMKCSEKRNIEIQKSVFNGFRDVPSLLIDPVGVDASNMKSTVIADGFLKESDIYSN